MGNSEPTGMGSIGCMRMESGRLEPIWKLWAEGGSLHASEGVFLRSYSMSRRARVKAAIQRANDELELGRIVE